MNQNREEFSRWFRQAGFDLEAANVGFKSGSFEWACFQAQQAVEKALKAVLFLHGKRSVFSHSVHKLVQELVKIDPKFKAMVPAKKLDTFFIPTRYPNGLPDSIPHEFYDEEDAKFCVNCSRKVLKFLKRYVDPSPNS